MPSLYNQQVAANYNKARTISNFGGRQLTFLVLGAWEDWYAGDPNKSAIGEGMVDSNTGGYNKLWNESGSRYEIAVNAIGSVSELVFLGEPMPAGSDGPGNYPEEYFVFAIATDTRSNWYYTENGPSDEEEVDENHEATSLYLALADALGHTEFNISKMEAQGDYFGTL